MSFGSELRALRFDPAKVGPDLEPRVDYPPRRMQREWELMTAEQQEEIFRPWFNEAAKYRLGDDDPRPHQFAMHKVMEWRRWWGTLSVRYPEAARALGLLDEVSKPQGVVNDQSSLF